MQILVLCVSLFLAASPSKADPLIEDIRSDAETTLSRIQIIRSAWVVTPRMEPTPPVEGLTSTCHYLGLLQDKLHGMDRSDRIHMDIQGIRGWVCHYASTMNCPIRERLSATMAPVHFPRTDYFRTLDMVEGYLTKILSSNRLTVC